MTESMIVFFIDTERAFPEAASRSESDRIIQIVVEIRLGPAFFDL